MTVKDQRGQNRCVLCLTRALVRSATLSRRQTNPVPCVCASAGSVRVRETIEDGAPCTRERAAGRRRTETREQEQCTRWNSVPPETTRQVPEHGAEPSGWSADARPAGPWTGLPGSYQPGGSAVAHGRGLPTRNVCSHIHVGEQKARVRQKASALLKPFIIRI